MPLGNSKEKIACPQCGCGHCTVVNTYTHETKFGLIKHPDGSTSYASSRTIIRRRRVCRYCGWAFFTIETYEDNQQPGHPLPPDTPTNILTGSAGLRGTSPKKDSTRKVQKSKANKHRKPPDNPYLSC